MAGVKGRSGGFRPGAGRKPRSATANWLSGHRRVAVGAPSPPRPAEAPAVVPVALEESVRAVWEELAPLAITEGTLTARTTRAFVLLCRAIVIEGRLAASPLAAGPDHRGMLQRVEAGMARFRLTPDGKPVDKAAPADEWAAFDVIQGGRT